MSREQLEEEYLKHSDDERRLQGEFLDILDEINRKKDSLKKIQLRLALKRGEKKTAQHLKAQARIAMGISKQAAWMMERRILRLCLRCGKEDIQGVCEDCAKKPWVTKKAKLVEQ